MQLIKHGPDIPDELLQAQEEGRVVFFCGAGISVPTGLPNFKDLVTRIYKRLNEPRTTSERRDSRNHQYEAVLEQLESRLADGRRVVRKTMFDILSLNKRKNKELNLKTHKALLQLAGFAEGTGRMVTTNYDHCFTEAAKALNLSSVEGQSYQAPLLPIPGLDRWNGLFYLHGLMPEIYDDSAMQELVLTSADFGRAYLKDNWASHFIIELLRHYSVCFVGYSINDTVMRYLLDALAADTGSRQQVWAFASYKPGKKLEAQSEWETKKVQPILFESSSKFSNYRLLHETLQEWARKQSGGNWRKELIEQSVRLSPLESSLADDYVGRMIWALSDEKGKGAELLASLPELPSFDWVKAFSESRFTTSDLICKGFFSESLNLNERPQFSLLRRGYPCGKGRQMALVRYPEEIFYLDPRMDGLATWVARFWDDPHLVQWVEDQGGQLDEEFIDKIRDQLAHADAVVEPKRDHQRLEQAVYWLQKLNGTATRRDSFQLKFSNWVQDFKRWGLTGSLRIRLRECLRPWVRNRINPDFELSDREKKLGLWSDIEISLSEDDFEVLKNSKLWLNCQCSLLADYEILLTDVLRLFEELGSTGEQDWSVNSMPFVGDRLGNRRVVSWTLLIELLRDAWLQQVSADSKEAIATAERWYAQPFMLFKRMAFFAASVKNILPVTVWSQWLFDKNGAYLVSSFTRREVQQLLSSRGRELNNQKQKALQRLIKNKYQEDVDLVGALYAQCERSTLLNSCRIGGIKLTRESNRFLANVSKGIQINPGKKAEGESIPEELSKLIDWVKRQEQQELTPRRWRLFNEFCCENLDLCYTALIMLHEEGADSVQFWRIGLSVFTVVHIGWERWARLLTILPQLPVTALFELRQSIAWWMLGAFENIDQTICQDNPQLRKQVVLTITLLLSIGRAKTGAMNSSDEVNGLLMRALLRFWNKIGKPTVDQKIPVDIQSVLDLVCSDKTEMWCSARKNLAKYTVALYLVDPEWTRTKLLPLFHWQINSKEAAEVWYGFLLGSRWHPTLMQEVKTSFFTIADHLDQMSDSVTPYVAMLVSMGLTYPRCYSQVELKSLFSKFTKDMRLMAIRQIENGLSQMSQNDKIRNWYHVLMPFFKKIWPRNKGESDSEISQRYCSLLMKADELFPKVFEIFRPLLSKAKYDYLVLKNLRETRYCNIYPRETLEFLDLVLGDQVTRRDWLQECINTIALADVTLKRSIIYKKNRKINVKTNKKLLKKG